MLDDGDKFIVCKIDLNGDVAGWKDVILDALHNSWADDSVSKRFRKSSPMLRADQAKRLLPCLIPGAGGHVWIAYRDQVSSGDVEQVDVESAPTTSRNAVIGLGHHRPWCREKEFKVEAVAIWMESGRLMGDTTEKKAVVDEYKERQAGKRSVEDVEVDGMSEEREKEWSSGPGGIDRIIKARNEAFPTLWKDTHHLHVLATVPSARRCGLGAALVREAHRWFATEWVPSLLSSPAGLEEGESRCESSESARRAELSLCTHTNKNVRYYERLGYKLLWNGPKRVYDNGDENLYAIMTRPAGA